MFLNSMIIGIIGKANVGKSTFFKATTLSNVEIANYPFATINPNKGIGYVKIKCVCGEFDKQCTPREGYCIKKNRFLPVEIIDVAGLVPGAHEGKGMGNKFLDDLRQSDGFIHVIDISGSTNENGESVETGSYDPAKDIKWFDNELDLWYLGILEKGWKRLARQIKQEKKKTSRVLGEQLSGLKITEDNVKEIITKIGLDDENPNLWSNENLHGLAKGLRKKKPCIVACNKIDLPGAYDNYERLKKEFPDIVFIPVSAEVELALKEASKKEWISYIPGENHFEIADENKLNDKQKKALEFMKNFLDKYKTTGVQNCLNKLIFNTMKMIAIYPGGVNNLVDSQGRVLPDCFLMPHKTTALDFAYKLHTDFGKNFIRAIDVKTKRTIGKDHELKHRDVVEIVSGK